MHLIFIIYTHISSYTYIYEHVNTTYTKKQEIQQISASIV